jgi:peptide/nickel transport system substrate-binding protein
MKQRLWTLGVLVVVLATVLSGCGTTPAPTTEATPAAAGATQAPATQATQAPVAEATQAPEATTAPTSAPAARKVATFIWTQEFDTLNPLYTNMWFSTTTFELWQCDAWMFDDKAQPIPSLVTEMPSTANGGLSTDGKIVTLKLRPDAVWSDGTPLTSADFNFTYQMYINTANAVSTVYPYDQLEKLETPDPQTVVMTFKEPFAAWPIMWRGIIPEHILKPVFEKDGTLDQAEWNKKPTVGCGPFVFQEWESGSFARFVANEKYWLGRPKIDEIFFRFVPDDASQIAALKAGDGDIGTFIAYSDIPSLKEAGITVIPAFSMYNEGIYFGFCESNHPAVKDVNVRKAIAYATDRFSLNKDLLLGGTVPAATDWDQTIWNDPSLQPYPFDPEQAKTLLDQAGWIDSNGDGTRDKDGKELVLKYGTTTREIRKDTQAVIQQQLAAVGIGVELLNYESDLFFAGYSDQGPAATGQLDIFEYSTSPSQPPDPDTGEWLSKDIPTAENPAGNNWMCANDPKLDELFSLQRTQVDPAERQQTWHQITKYIYDNMYWLGLWQDPDIWAVGKRVTGVKISGATPLYNVMEWDLTQ